ncbi:sensor histidine kinase [Kitasatospora sp. LaBMicrA B282]|uniref:sensor histidine kinase n=1 Tax=Kitasatospora sp. LaBMicrA B282 TaxID=3420949 RepID=UPI003D105E36
MRLTLRTALMVLAIVPSVALAALWGVTTGQTLSDFQRQAAQVLLAQKAGQPASIVYYNLQEERRLSAQQLAQPGSVTDALARQRAATDDAVRTFLSESSVSSAHAPADVRAAVGTARTALGQLPEHRAAVDSGTAKQDDMYVYYSTLINVDLGLFTSLGHVDNGQVSYLTQTLVSEFWAKEMVAREDAILAGGWSTGRLSVDDYQSLQQAIGGQVFLFNKQIVPYLPPNEAATAQALTNSAAWQEKTLIEGKLLTPTAAGADGTVPLPAAQAQWRDAIDKITPQMVALVQSRTDSVVATGKNNISSLLMRVVLTSVIGLVAVIAVIITSWRLTRSLRRRIVGLQDRAGELERTLPDLVERLGRGEQVRVEEPGARFEADQGHGDELSRLGQTLDLARQSAVGAAIAQAEQHRGFERLLQRIARRTQLLIGLQLKTLDEMERRHEDPEVLEGLFDLDHLTARLRRYEENLVILAGGQPQRRWRKPVPLLDVLRAAQGEVQDYRRILIDVEGMPWLSERAVGPVVHVLAELMENAAAFSKPPTPVEVRAAMVGRGLAVEVEDRGLGMEPEQIDAANALMRRPPRMDVLAQADDVRLGLYVVSRIADSLGLRVEFRPSAFGGTRAVVLIPGELVHDGALLEPIPAEPAMPLPSRVRGRTLPVEEPQLAPHLPPAQPLPAGAAPMTGAAPMADPMSMTAPTARPSWAASASDHERTAENVQPPLPQRVRQASLAAELRIPPPEEVPQAPGAAQTPPAAPIRSGAAIGAFQRRSRAARFNDFGDETTELTPIPTEKDPS